MPNCSLLCSYSYGDVDYINDVCEGYGWFYSRLTAVLSVWMLFNRHIRHKLPSCQVSINTHIGRIRSCFLRQLPLCAHRNLMSMYSIYFCVTLHLEEHIMYCTHMSYVWLLTEEQKALDSPKLTEGCSYHNCSWSYMS